MVDELQINELYRKQRQMEQRACISRVVPHDYAGGFDSFVADTQERKTVKKKAVVWASAFRPYTSTGLILQAAHGAGKTHLAYGIIKALMQEGFFCKAVNTSGLLYELRATWPNPHDSEDAMITRTLNCDVLLLDDFGAGEINAGVVERLYLLLNHVCIHKYPTVIITAMYNNDNLARRLGRGLGEALMSRISGACLPLVGFPEADYRKRGPKDE